MDEKQNPLTFEEFTKIWTSFYDKQTCDIEFIYGIFRDFRDKEVPASEVAIILKQMNEKSSENAKQLVPIVRPKNKIEDVVLTKLACFF